MLHRTGQGRATGPGNSPSGTETWAAAFAETTRGRRERREACGEREGRSACRSLLERQEGSNWTCEGEGAEEAAGEERRAERGSTGAQEERIAVAIAELPSRDGKGDAKEERTRRSRKADSSSGAPGPVQQDSRTVGEAGEAVNAAK